MGDANDGYRISPQEIVQCPKQRLPVGLVKPLARLVENQQRWLLDKCTSEQRHTLQSSREGEVGTVGKRQQPQSIEPLTSDAPLSRADLPWWTNNILETRLYHFEACHFTTEIEMQLWRHPTDATLDFPNGFASATPATENKNSIGVKLWIITDNQAK
jgi:hypothetical protein